MYRCEQRSQRGEDGINRIKSPAFAMNLEKINELTAQDMAGVNATILEQLNSDVQLINQLGYYIVSGGGKRIRPMIAVLAARAVGL